MFAYLAQSVEHAAVNRRVVGSSPTVGAKKANHAIAWLFFCAPTGLEPTTGCGEFGALPAKARQRNSPVDCFEASSQPLVVTVTR